MTDALERRRDLRREAEIHRHRSDSGTINTPGKNRTPGDPLQRARPAGNRRLRELPYTILLAERSKSLRTTNSGCSATSSRRRVLRQVNGMHDTHPTDPKHSPNQAAARSIIARVPGTSPGCSPTRPLRGRSTGIVPGTIETARRSRRYPSQFQASTHFGGVEGGCRNPDPPLTPPTCACLWEVSDD